VAVVSQRRPRPLALAALVVVAFVAGCVPPVQAHASATAKPAVKAPAAEATPRPTPIVRSATSPNLSQLVGQRLIVAMDGTTVPSPGLLGRIRRGEIGGVILFGRNVTTAAALKALTKQLRDAAAAGGQPPLLIAVDQEGGSIKRIPWAPPTLSPPQMGADGRTSTARSQGASTGVALAGLGINVDLAPVADVPAFSSSIINKQGRAFSFNPSVVSALTNAFAEGLESEDVLPTMKHFPGLGYAKTNTDTSVVTITASKTALAPGLEPYHAAVANHLPIVMLSNATYTAYDSANAAGWSRAIGTTLLRGDLGFKGVTMTDSLDGTAHARGVTTASLALRAARAGTDLILVTGSQATSGAVFDALYQAAKSGTLNRTALLASYARILDLKAGL
jgi:beta-N-acetylhexosaminidase